MGKDLSSRQRGDEATADSRPLSTKDKKIIEAGKRIAVSALIRGMVASGEVNVTGLSPKEVTRECLKAFLASLASQPVEFDYSIDHTRSLVSDARRFHRGKKHQMALMLYAVACEHWLNEIISVYFRRKGISEKEAAQVIRSVNFEGKFTWLPPLLDLPRVPAHHAKRLKRLGDLRNEFVHYKWKPLDLDHEEDKPIKSLLRELGATISYLVRYRDKYVYQGQNPRRLGR